MVEWTDPAKQDLKSIHDYIARDSKLYAKKVSFEIVEKSEKLNIFPESGTNGILSDPEVSVLLKHSNRYSNTRLSLCITSSEYLYPRIFSITELFLPLIFSISENE